MRSSSRHALPLSPFAQRAHAPEQPRAHTCLWSDGVQCLQILTPIQGAYAFVGTWPWLPDKFAILTTIVESAESHQQQNLG